MTVLHLSIPAKPEYLVFTRLVLTGLSRTTEIDAETLADLKVAVSEICSRAVRRASADGGSEEIQLRYELDGDVLLVEVEEEAATAESALEQEADTLNEDAMGLAIVQALVDELELSPAEDVGRSRLSLRKRLR
jgi:serine/threonine-protein kinase RsbW